jgi:uncharacterized membrane protein YbjE (DUF340 family)
MAQSTAPVLGAAGLLLGTNALFYSESVEKQTRIVGGTVVTVVTLAVLERISPALAVGIGWTILAAVALTRIQPGKASPVELIDQFLNEGRKS